AGCGAARGVHRAVAAAGRRTGHQRARGVPGEMGPHIHELLRAADVFSLPSRLEGLGKAILEAMVSGIPAIICEGEWVADEIVKHDETGFVVPRDPKALADAIIHVAQHPDAVAPIVQRGIAHVHELYGADAISSQMEMIYQEALDKRG
ncbi:glycosyltransferase, partial [bacterium]|nr:glycosyltransferase [bacterium]